MSPLFPHAPGSLCGSVPCILLLEKGVKCKGHYYCLFKVSDNPVMYYRPGHGNKKLSASALEEPSLVAGTHL